MKKLQTFGDTHDAIHQWSTLAEAAMTLLGCTCRTLTCHPSLIDPAAELVEVAVTCDCQACDLLPVAFERDGASMVLRAQVIA